MIYNDALNHVNKLDFFPAIDFKLFIGGVAGSGLSVSILIVSPPLVPRVLSKTTLSISYMTTGHLMFPKGCWSLEEESYQLRGTPSSASANDERTFKDV